MNAFSGSRQVLTIMGILQNRIGVKLSKKDKSKIAVSRHKYTKSTRWQTCDTNGPANDSVAVWIYPIRIERGHEKLVYTV